MSIIRSIAAVTAACAVAGCAGSDQDADSTRTTTSVAPKISEHCTISNRILASVDKDDPEAVQDAFATIDRDGATFVATAPAELQAAAQRFVDGTTAILDDLASVDYDITRLDPSQVEAVSNPDFQAAADQITAYNADHCAAAPTTASTPPAK